MELPLIVFDRDALHLPFRQGDVLRYNPSDPTPWTLYRPLADSPDPGAILAALMDGTATTYDVSPGFASSAGPSGPPYRDLLLRLLKR